MKLIRLLCIALAGTLLLARSATAAPLLHWAMEEGTGTTTADTGDAPAAPGTLVNSGWTTNTPGAASTTAIDTSGAASGNLKYVTGGDADKLDSLSAFTLTTWINFQATPSGNRRIMSKQNAGGFEGFSWNVSDAGNGAPRSASAFGARLFVGGTTAFAFDGVPNDPNFVIDANNKWTFIAVSYDGTSTSNNVKYYAGSSTGGVTLLSTTTVDGGTTLPSAAAFNIGHTDAAPTADTSLPGFVDDARVYGSVLTLSELDDVRLANVPEPAAAGVLVFAAFGLLARRQRVN